MALTVTSRGTGTHNSGATTLVPGGRSATLAVGSLGVLCIALDNAGTSGSTLISPASWTDAKGNVWTRRLNALYDNGAASAGIEMVIYTAPITVALLTTDAGTITWSPAASPVAKAWTWYEVIPSANAEAVYLTGGSIAGATAANAQVTTASIAVGDAVVAGYFSENVNAVTGDSDALNGSWTAQQTATVGSTTSGVRIATQQKVQTTTPSAQVYDATVASQDRIAGYIAVHEQHTAQASVTATGGGVAAEVATGGRTVAATATGGGVAAASTKGAHNAAVTAAGGGVLTNAGAGGRQGSATATGSGVTAVTGSAGMRASVTAAGAGVTTVDPTAGRQTAISATGGGILTHTYEAISAENHDATVVATGGGAVSVVAASGLSVAEMMTGGGIAVVVPVAGRHGQVVATGAGLAVETQSTSRATSIGTTGGGVAVASAKGAHNVAATATGGGAFTSIGVGDKPGSATATGAGVAAVTGSAGKLAGIVAAGGGVASVVPIADRQIAATATGGGVLTHDYSVSSIENHDAIVVAGGGGAAAVAVASARSIIATLTGTGAVSVAPVAGRVTSTTVSAAGIVAVSVQSARLVAALMSGGGVLTSDPTTNRRSTIGAMGGGAAIVTGVAARAGHPVVSVTITGSGVVKLSAVTQVPQPQPSDGRPATVRYRPKLIPTRRVSVHTTGGGAVTIDAEAWWNDDDLVLELISAA